MRVTVKVMIGLTAVRLCLMALSATAPLTVLADSDELGDVASSSAAGQLDSIRLTDIYGKGHRLADLRGDTFTVVTFLGTECPLARLYAPRLSRLANEFEARGVRFVGVNSNCQDNLTEIGSYARRYGMTTPMFKDVGHHLADRLGAERTPETFVIDRSDAVVYHGRIDDQYGVGYSRDKPTRDDLKRALEALTSGHRVEVANTDVVGCFIGRQPKPDEDASVTYSNQIARIFQKQCVECHREGQIAPFALTDYDEAVGWAETIAEVIRDQRMPPWHANPKHGAFANGRIMTEAEKQLVYDWVDLGAPLGDPNDLPEPTGYVTGWRLPKRPDVVIPMRDRAFTIPAEGTVEYQYFVADPGFTEEKWIKSAEVIPGNFGVVHHCIVFVRPPDADGLRGFGWLAAYVPGQAPVVLPEGMGRRVPAGSKLIFQMHYTPNGTPQKDLTKVGVVFADDESITQELVTLGALNRDFEIPPAAKDYVLEASMDWFPPGGQVVSLAPHMHVRGKTFRFTARAGDTERVLLDVPNYDFNWQHVYVLDEPLPLPEDTTIHCRATFDNSADNLVNPDPTVPVTWGDQTWQEMMVGFVDVAVDRSTKIALPWDDAASSTVAAADLDAFFDRFDTDGDGLVQRREVPTWFVFAFWAYDENHDNQLSRTEAANISE